MTLCSKSVILDLGISRIASNTQTMTAVGSVAWTAPEILRKEHYNEKVDVYSYGKQPLKATTIYFLKHSNIQGIVLWELFSGKEPYEGKGRVEAAIAVVTTGLRPPVYKDWSPDWVYLMQRYVTYTFTLPFTSLLRFPSPPPLPLPLFFHLQLLERVTR